MKFELTPTEYRRLIELIYVGEWLINAHRAGVHNPRVDLYEAIIQKLYAHAPKAGLSDWIDYFPLTDSFSPTRQMEEESSCERYIHEYDEHTFWDELCHRLAERDLLQEIGRDAVVALPGMERVEQLLQREQAWRELFIKDGLDCLTVKETTMEDADSA